MPRNFRARCDARRCSPSCFNEAAADAAEFFPDYGRVIPQNHASMRPRQMPRNFPLASVRNLSARMLQ